MFGLGFWEIGMILAIALIFFGPSKLPEIARGLGKGLREFRKATEDFKSTINDELYKPEQQPPPRQALGSQEVLATTLPANTATTPAQVPSAEAAPAVSGGAAASVPATSSPVAAAAPPSAPTLPSTPIATAPPAADPQPSGTHDTLIAPKV